MSQSLTFGVVLLCVFQHVFAAEIDLGLIQPAATARDDRADFKTATTQPAPTTKAIIREADKGHATISIRFVKLDKEGEPVDLTIEAVELLCEQSRWAAGFRVEASTLELQVGSNFSNTMLKEDATYRVRGYPLSPEFTLPHLKQGDYVKVSLVVDDDRGAMATPVEAAPTTQAAELHVELPGWVAEGAYKNLGVCYRTPKSVQWLTVGGDGIVRAEVDGLGGELLVQTAGDNTARALVYVHRVAKTPLILDEGADFTSRNADGEELTLSFDGVEVPPGIKVAGILYNDRARLPLFVRSFDPKKDKTVRVMRPGPQAVVFVGDDRGRYYRCRVGRGTDNMKVEAIETLEQKAVGR